MTNNKAAIAMSGGVDSSVAASLLMKDGYEVMGVTMLVCPVTFINEKGESYSPEIAEIKSLIGKFIYGRSGERSYLGVDGFIDGRSGERPYQEMDGFVDGRSGERPYQGVDGFIDGRSGERPYQGLDGFIDGHSGERPCRGWEGGHEFPPGLFLPPLNSLLDAANICKALNIPHHILDLRKDFGKTIIDYFAEEYYAGRTPNPCVQCNPRIKFGLLMDYAVQLGADFFATGHYARVRKNENTGLFELLRGIDDSKDQAYALFKLTQQQLSRILFPLGGMTKETVRKIAADLNLSVKEKPESQEICFIPDEDYIRFLRERYSGLEEPGDIMHVNGEIMGRHKGLIHYTVGQRKRLGIAHPKPLYVLKIDAVNNRLIVGYWEDLFLTGAIVGNLHFISGKAPEDAKIMAKIRYNQKQVPAALEMIDEKTSKIIFDEPVRAVTPGQAAVFYSYPDGERVLGGGTILQA